MLIMPSFKKSLIVAQFQGNYLKNDERSTITPLEQNVLINSTREIESASLIQN